MVAGGTAGSSLKGKGAMGMGNLWTKSDFTVQKDSSYFKTFNGSGVLLLEACWRRAHRHLRQGWRTGKQRFCSIPHYLPSLHPIPPITMSTPLALALRLRAWVRGWADKRVPVLRRDLRVSLRRASWLMVVPVWKYGLGYRLRYSIGLPWLWGMHVERMISEESGSVQVVSQHART